MRVLRHTYFMEFNYYEAETPSNLTGADMKVRAPASYQLPA